MIKNKIRKIVSSFISCLVSLNIIFTLGCVNIYASTNSYNYDPSIISTYNGKIDTGYSYKGTFVASSINGNIEYDDAWFIDNYSYTYNHDISTFLYKAETASFHIFFTSDPAANIKKLFDTLGYKYTDNITEGETLDSPDSIVYSETSAGFDYQDPSKDAFGYGIGYKNVKFDDGSIYTFIGIGTRGAGYETEWASNFTVGESGDHQGFKQAAKAVENKLIDIIDEIDTPYPICIWLTGYSRGGSVADILGNYLNEDALNNKLGNTKPENIFTYTFETPLSRDVNVNKNNTTYTFNNKTVNLNDNIFNVYNTIDFVASVPMEDLGFGQYGRPKVLPNSLTYPDYYNSSIYKKMKDNYKNNLLANYSTSGYANYVDEYVAQAPNQRELINTYTYLLSQLVNNSRSVFINDTNLQKTLRLILGGMESGRELSKIDVQYRYKPLISSETNSGTITINLEDDLDIASIALDLISLISRFKNNQIRQYYITLHMSNEDGSEFGKEKVTLTADQFKLVYNALPSEITDCLDDVSKLINMVSNYETELAEVEEYYSGLIDYVKYNHYPELDYAWMMSGNEEELFKNFTYNQVRIPAKANVYVKYKGNTVASIESGKITKEQLECFIDDNGDYVFDVPNNSDYTIEITLTGTSSKNIEVNTYNINTKQKLRDFKYSLSGGKSGDVFVLNMSKKSESLIKNSNNQTLSVNRYEDITDVVIKLDYDNTKTSVSGNGKYTLYDHALLKTTPNTGYELDGYYNEHHKLLSEDSEYNHLAHDNETIYVEVNPIEYTITYDLGDAQDPGNPSTYTIESDDITLLEPSLDGYTFDGWTSSQIQTPTKVITISKGSVGDKSFVANFTPIEYTITYNLDGGSVSGTNKTTYNIETNTFTLINPTKNGYTFIGWTSSEIRYPVKDITISKGSVGDKSYTANYEPITYNIIYHLDGGTNNPNNISKYTVETTNTTLYNPTKSGYEFEGWYLDSLYKNKVTRINVNICADIDLYAKFVNDGMYVDVSGLGLKENDEVYVDGVLTSVNSDSKIFTSRTTKLLTTYTYKNALDSDVHANYPTSMKTYLLKYQKDRVGTITHLDYLDNALIYAGTSIKITGNKGIRSITSIPTSLKNALTSSGINGYKAIEYGTIMGWASNLDENEEPTIYKQNDGTYKATKGTKAKAYDRATNYLMTYKEANGTSKYTNPLVGNFSNDDCSRDFAIRPYMILTDGTNEIVSYGGTLYRSISYVAYQCRNDFKPNTSSYEYVWNLIKAGYGDKYNSEYIH